MIHFTFTCIRSVLQTSSIIKLTFWEPQSKTLTVIITNWTISMKSNFNSRWRMLFFIDRVIVIIFVPFLIGIYASVMAVYDSLNNTTEWDWLQGWRVRAWVSAVGSLSSYVNKEGYLLVGQIQVKNFTRLCTPTYVKSTCIQHTRDRLASGNAVIVPKFINRCLWERCLAGGRNRPSGDILTFFRSRYRPSRS
jgi:hypothetical protein